ncbi:MAG: ATP-binding cassette domain-containing protein [Actinomycetota bacterium]
MISAAGVRYRYVDPGPVVELEELSIEQGSLSVFKGSSGSGKSTLLRLFAGLAPWHRGGVASGRVQVGDIDMSRLDRDLADRIGFVAQDPEGGGVAERALEEVAFVLENIGEDARSIRARANRALSSVGAEHLADRRLDQLSSGERARVAIAAAIAPDPEVLLLDEPFGPLDSEATASLRELLDGFRGRATVVLAEHRTQSVADLADRVFELTEEPGPRESWPTCQPRQGRLVADDLRITLAGRQVLKGVSLWVEPGETVAVTGPNGAGKSTLLRALVGALEPASGSVRVNGWDPRGHDRAGEHIAYLPQRVERIFCRATVEDEIAFTQRCRGVRIEPGGCLEAIGIAELAKRSPRQLSAGQKLRVALAAITAGAPSVLILDEPTRGLDAHARGMLSSLLRAHTNAGGCAIVATHDSDLVRLADRRVELEAYA